jgi:hypothetical protein
MAFYGDLFRKKGTKSLGIPPYDENDVTFDVDFVASTAARWQPFALLPTVIDRGYKSELSTASLRPDWRQRLDTARRLQD